MAAIRTISIVFSFALQIWLLSIYGAHTYGNYIFAITTCAFLSIISKGGLDLIALKQAATNQESPEKFNQTCTFYLSKGITYSTTCCLLFFTIHSLILYYLPNFTPINWWLTYITTTGLVGFQIIISIIRGTNHQVLADLFDSIIRSLLMVAAVVIFSEFQLKTSESAIAAYAVSFYLGCAILIYLKAKNNPKKKLSKKNTYPEDYSFHTHLSFTASGLLSYIFFQMDTLILGNYISANELGAYNMACNLVRGVIFIPMILTAIIQPRVSIAFSNTDTREIIKISIIAAGISLASSILFSTLLWLFGEYILNLINPEFKSAKNAMSILCLAHIANSVLIIITGVISMTTHHASIFKAQSIGAASTLILYAFLIPKSGQIGAAIAVFTGLIITLIYYALIYRNQFFKIYDFLLSSTFRK